MAAAAVCLADKVLYSGAHVAPIAATFAGRGITTGACAASDFPSFYVRILHPFSGDLYLNIKVGADVNAPVCTFDILDPDPLAWFPHLIGFGFFDQCGQHLPPTVSQPWWLEVQDVGTLDVGTIEDFQVLLAGGTRCWSSDTPLAIPDHGPPVPLHAAHQSGDRGLALLFALLDA